MDQEIKNKMCRVAIAFINGSYKEFIAAPLDHNEEWKMMVKSDGGLVSIRLSQVQLIETWNLE